MNDKVKQFIDGEESREVLDATREHLKERLTKLEKAREKAVGVSGRKMNANPTPAQLRRRKYYLKLKEKNK